MIDKKQVLKIAKECGATHPSAGRILIYTQYAFTIAELEAFAAAMYAKGAEDANRVLYDFVGRDFAHLEPRQALESHSIETRKENRDEHRP